MEIDRLSSLPENLLVDILRRLANTKTAIGTAVLSKRLRFVWTDLSDVSLCSRSRDPDVIERFVAGVRTVTACMKAPLEKLSVDFLYDKRFAGDVDAWLESAAKSEVKYLDLNLEPIYGPYSSSGRYTLPQAVYSHSPATAALWLRHCNLAPPAASVEWRSLTRLTIHHAELPQRAIDAIGAGCPVLRRLELYMCAGFRRLAIGGGSFRRLDVRYCDGDDYSGVRNDYLEISAPHMRHLNVRMDSRGKDLRLADVTSLEEARIDFYGRRLWNCQDLFEKMQRVKSLVLGSWILEEVSCMMRDNSWRFPESTVKELGINIESFTAENVSVVLTILESSPFLDKLFLRNSKHGKDTSELNPTVRVDLDRDLSHLKNVRIEIYVNRGLSSEMSFTLAQILLKSAPILEKMVIFLDGVSEELIEKFETLLTYPRSSRKAVVEFIGI